MCSSHFSTPSTVQIRKYESPHPAKAITLVYGPRKGGTTMLQRLLDSDEVICLPSETKIKNFVDAIPFHAPENRTHLTHFPQSQESGIGLDKAGYENQILRKLSSVASVQDAVNLHIDAIIDNSSCFSSAYESGMPVVIKEVGGDPVCVIDQFLRAFPEGKVISIRRKPSWVARAVFRNRAGRSLAMTSKNKIWQVIAPYWVDRGQQEYMNHPRVLTVHYEKIVHDTKTEMQQILDFLNWPSLSANLAPTIFGKPSIVDTASQQKIGVFTSSDNFSKGLKLRDLLLIRLGPLLYVMYLFIKKVRSTLRKINQDQHT